MEEEKVCEMIKAMAEEISILRRERDLEWGEYEEENYKIENIIRDYQKEYLQKGDYIICKDYVEVV